MTACFNHSLCLAEKCANTLSCRPISLTLLLFLVLLLSGCLSLSSGTQPLQPPQVWPKSNKVPPPSASSQPAPEPKPRTTKPKNAISAPNKSIMVPLVPVKPLTPRQYYDPKRPCFTIDTLKRARRSLFSPAYSSTNKKRAKHWMLALNQAYYELGLSCQDQDLLLSTLTIIQLESSVQIDPGLENKNLKTYFLFWLDRKPITRRMLALSGLRERLEKKLEADTKKGHVRTEAALAKYINKDFKPWLAQMLYTEYALPEKIAAWMLSASISEPIQTIGPMQVNVSKAYRNALQRGDPIASETQMRHYLLNPNIALLYGIKEGMAQFNIGYSWYRRVMPRTKALRMTAADYNAGEFSSRNAAFQQCLAKLNNTAIPLDGDLLAYSDGKATSTVSLTEKLARQRLPKVRARTIRRDFLLEKTPAFTQTKSWRTLRKRYQQKQGKPCPYAIIPAGAANSLAGLKYGRRYTPQNYSAAFIRLLKKNRKRFG